jgi:hypothetical protein
MDLYKDTPSRCRLLLFMGYIFLAASLALNGYILYGIGHYLSLDGFSFMGGLFIAFTLPFTIAISILVWVLIRQLRNNKPGAAVFFLIMAFPGMITAGILHNATFLWPYLLAFFILLIPASIRCKRTKAS